MMILNNTLVIINSKGRVQKVFLSLVKNLNQEIYTIMRCTGQYGGKETPQPDHVIEKGKVKRTVLEQATLEYNSIKKKYLDKGYVDLATVSEKCFSDLSELEIKNLLGVVTTDQAGIPKPMLAKIAGDCKEDIWDKNWYVSRKIDGTRCLMYFKGGEIHTASRGGGNYDAATTHLRTNPGLLRIFNLRPDLILDGELYHHGTDWPLQRISGLCRLKEWKEECSGIQYWVYDIVNEQPFVDRYYELKEISQMLSDKSIRVLEQKLISGYASAKAEHDKYVNEGFEGLCARNPNKGYGVGKRSGDYLIKLKERQDAEALIIDIKEGLRDEDMCFILQTPSGITFAAKPIGTIEQRLEYLKHKEDYLGKQMTYTYFNLSTDGVPTQPVAKHVRPDDE